MFSNTKPLPTSLSKLLVYLFFGIFLITGLSVYKDYGIGWDDPFGRENGIINAIFILEKTGTPLPENKELYSHLSPLMTYTDVDHGPIFELIPTFLELAFGIKDIQSIFLLRHLCIFSLFFISAIFFYLLLQRRLKNQLLSLAGVAMLVISPRIFADSFFNAKDIPFLSLCIISSYTMARFLDRKNFKNAIWHGLACGLTLDIRILGLIFPAMTFFLILFDTRLFRKDGESPVQNLKYFGAYILAFVAFTITFWPYLWVKPVKHFSEILARSSAYPWAGVVLYKGKYVLAMELPWDYLPVWIGITTPVFYLILFAIGFIFISYKVLANIGARVFLYKTSEERLDLAMLGFFVVPLAATIILHLVLYDAWRHMFFMHAFLIYVATIGLSAIYARINAVNSLPQRHKIKLTFTIVVIACFGQIAYWMIRQHPYQNVYFSLVGPQTAMKNYERDYWGLSYKQGLEFVLKDSDKPVINVLVSNSSGVYNRDIFPLKDRNRLNFVHDFTQADYFLTEHRKLKTSYPDPDKDVVYHIDADGIRIMSVYKMR